MTSGMKTIIYPVRDLAAPITLYTALLGARPYASAPYYVSFGVDGQEVGLDPNGHAHGMTGPLAHWRVDAIHARLTALVAAGATVAQDVRDVGGSKLVASVTDADGNPIGLVQQP